jgi:hypothetical protein
VPYQRLKKLFAIKLVAPCAHSTRATVRFGTQSQPRNVTRMQPQHSHANWWGRAGLGSNATVASNGRTRRALGKAELPRSLDGVHININRVVGRELALQQQLRQGVLNALLDSTLQGPRTKHRVEAYFG